MVEFETAKSWSAAKEIAALVGTAPSSFTTCIRFLRNDVAQNGGKLSKSSTFCLLRLLKSIGLRAPVYFCAKTFRPDSLQGMKYASPQALLSSFTAEEFSTIIALVYLYRKILKGCDPEEFKAASSNLFIQTDLGGFFGQALGVVGVPNGFLAGAMRHLGVAMFLGIDKKGFINYRRELKRLNALFDLEQEYQTWGCTHAQLASILLQGIAIGKETGSYITLGFSDRQLDALDSSSPEATGIRVATHWIDALHKTGKPPDVVHSAKYYPMAADLDTLLANAAQLRINGSPFAWLGKGKADVSPSDTPELFEGGAEAVKAEQEISKAVSEELRSQIKDEDLAVLEDDKN